MHELSIAQGIVELAEQIARDNEAEIIEELELEIGCLSGVEIHAFEFALESAVKGTILEKTVIVRNDIAGEGRCGDCEKSFPVDSFFMSCPHCGSYAVKIIKGKELRIKSIVVK